MRILGIAGMLFLFIASAWAQSEPVYTYHKHWVTFTDKNSTPYSLDDPLTFLSQRALDRRAAQSVALSTNDLPVTPQYIDSLAALGATVLNRSKWFNAVTIQTTDTILLQTISNLSFVQAIEPVAATIIAQADEVTEDESVVKVKENTVRSQYGESYNQIAMMRGDYLHEDGYRGEGMIIAVLDAGFYKVNELSAFDSLWYNNQILGTWDFVDGEYNVFDDGSHGMAVLSTMGGNLPGKIVGTAPKADYWLFRTEEGASEYRVEEDNWIAAAERADSLGADVINSSLGYSTFDDSSMNYTYSDMNGDNARITRGADIAASKGMLIVTSAGNHGNSAWHYISAPADGDSVLTVGAVDPYGNVTSFSSRGPTFDGRVKPNVVAKGQGTIVVTGNDDVYPSNGTSFSSPVLAGLAACLWQAHPDKTNMEILSIIEKSADHYFEPDADYGYGIPDFQKAHLLMLSEQGPAYQRENLPLAYPNPFGDELSVMIFTKEEGLYTLEIFDSFGQRIVQYSEWLGAEHFHRFDPDGMGILQSGMYYARVRSGSSHDIIKVMKL